VRRRPAGGRAPGLVPFADEVEELLAERVAAGERERGPPLSTPGASSAARAKWGRSRVVAIGPLQERADAPVKTCELIFG
jgi:hypothetical protein